MQRGMVGWVGGGRRGEEMFPEPLMPFPTRTIIWCSGWSKRARIRGERRSNVETRGRKASLFVAFPESRTSTDKADRNHQWLPAGIKDGAGAPTCRRGVLPGRRSDILSARRGTRTENAFCNNRGPIMKRINPDVHVLIPGGAFSGV